LQKLVMTSSSSDFGPELRQIEEGFTDNGCVVFYDYSITYQSSNHKQKTNRNTAIGT